MGAITSVGRWTRSTMLAMVKVLPLPVTPSKVCVFIPDSSPATSWSTALGWSPIMRKSEVILNLFSTAVVVVKARSF